MAFTIRSALLNSKDNWICCSSSVESAASIFSPSRELRRSSSAASPLNVLYSARIHFPDFITRVQILSRFEMLQIPENLPRSAQREGREFPCSFGSRGMSPGEVA